MRLRAPEDRRRHHRVTLKLAGAAIRPDGPSEIENPSKDHSLSLQTRALLSVRRSTGRAFVPHCSALMQWNRDHHAGGALPDEIPKLS